LHPASRRGPARLGFSDAFRQTARRRLVVAAGQFLLGFFQPRGWPLTQFGAYPTPLGFNAGCPVVAAGVLALGAYLSWRFGKAPHGQMARDV
jgi:hypothetical protein